MQTIDIRETQSSDVERISHNSVGHEGRTGGLMHEIRIPRLGWSMEEGTFVRWLKQHGETVKIGEALFELEGDKSVQEIETVEGGLLHIPPDSPQPGATVAVGTLLGYLLAAAETAPGAESRPTPAGMPADQPAAAGHLPLHSVREPGDSPENVIGTGGSEPFAEEDVPSENEPTATPRARRVAAELGVDWRPLRGSGRSGRIREADILAAAEIRRKAELPVNTFGSLSPRRRAIAERLRRSRELTVPVTLTTTADVTELVALRNRLKAANPQLPPSYTDIAACLLPWVFKDHPRMAVVWDADRRGLIPFDRDEIHIGIAVDAPDGLLVPVIRQAGVKPLQEITSESRRLIELARTGRLPGEFMSGGVFTITNLGSYGIDAFTPVINLPEISILGLGAIRREPVIMPDDRILPRLRMTLSLTFDHAAVDGAPAAAFLKDIAAALNDPAAFILKAGV